MVLSLLMAGVSFAGGASKFKAEEFADPAKAAKKYVGVNAKKLKELKGKKLIVVECSGEFVRSKTKIEGGFDVEKQWLTMNQEWNVKAVDGVYDAMKQMLEANGITVAPKEELTSNASYQEMNLKSEKGTKSYKGGIGKQAVSTKGEKVAASGMGVFGLGGEFGLAKRLPHIIQETGSQGSLRISFYVDWGKDSAPVLSKFSVTYDGDLIEQEVGFKGHKKMDYYNKTQNAGLFSLKKPLASQANVRGEKRGQIDMEKYNQALMEMVNAVVNSFSAGLQAGK
jgi:hypothetical protein